MNEYVVTRCGSCKTLLSRGFRLKPSPTQQREWKPGFMSVRHPKVVQELDETRCEDCLWWEEWQSEYELEAQFLSILCDDCQTTTALILQGPCLQLRTSESSCCPDHERLSTGLVITPRQTHSKITDYFKQVKSAK